MQVMVLEQDQVFQAQIAAALMEKGFHVICVESRAAAETFLRLDFIDVLVLGERIGGRLSHPVALLAECRNPLVAAILLTDRAGPELDEVFELMPAVSGVLGRQVGADMVVQVVLSSVQGASSETVRKRMLRRWTAAEAAHVPGPPSDVWEDENVETFEQIEEAASAHPVDHSELTSDEIAAKGVEEVATDAPPALPVLVLSTTAFPASRLFPQPEAPANAWSAFPQRAQTVGGVTTGWLNGAAGSAVGLALDDYDKAVRPNVGLRERRLHLA